MIKVDRQCDLQTAAMQTAAMQTLFIQDAKITWAQMLDLDGVLF